MAEETTLSYSDGVKGWPSRFSYLPEFLIGLNTYLYSFDGGNLYRHNTNPSRNNYYGVQRKSSITGVFNDRPMEIKLFKTMSFESSAAWSCTNLITDLSSGSMLSSQFVQKEGEWFTFIRENASTLNFKLRSAHGIGNVTDVQSVSSPTSSFVITFGTVDLGNIISGGTSTTGGDQVFVESSGVNKLLGRVVSVDRANSQIVLQYSGTPPTIAIGDFLYYYKNVVAESHGARGYFMEFTLELDASVTEPVELFSVGSSVMKSFP